jgi:hypothetical protein
MSKFITGKELEEAVYNIIWNAKETLLIVCPYIKLENYFRELFDHHQNNHKLSIIIVFGKNEGDVKRSLKKDDFEFFKKFLNISIVHIPNLHAKYYGNETQGVISSINLHDFSFRNNIEFGVYAETSLFNSINKSVDNKAWDTSIELANEGDVVFIKRPMYEKKLLGKNYIKSSVLVDNTENYYANYPIKTQKKTKKLSDFEDELEFGVSSDSRPQRQEIEAKTLLSKPQTGYCIRSGKQIPFNPSQPFCYEAYQQWAQWGNPDYAEKYCHKTGILSKGKTSKNKPILY